MGSLFLQIGQCGCQIGVPLNAKLSSCYYCTRVRPPNRLHSIMIDTQPKVIRQILSKQPKWLDPSNVKYFQHGRGNNWSYGYLHQLPEKGMHTEKINNHGKKQFSHIEPATLQKYITQNKQIAQYTMERVRRELQSTDCAMNINVIGSLGGGTGSGLGTKLVQCLHQQFNLNIYSHFVFPNKSGQSPLQTYNCLLSLSSLQEHSSAIFTYQNDKMISLFHNLYQKESTLTEINEHLASNISRLVKINEIDHLGRLYSQMVSDCVVSEQMKFLNLYGQKQEKGNWDQCLKGLTQEVKNYLLDQYKEEFTQGYKAKRDKLIQGQLLLLGPKQSVFEEKYSKKIKYVLNPLFQDSFNVQQFSPKGKEESVEAVLVSNHSSITNYLGFLVNSGRKKYEAGAYLWHYQYADVQEAINSVQNVVEQYHYTTETN